MTGRGDRPCTCDGYDRVRGNVAMAKLGNALGVKLDASLPDHVLLEQLAEQARRAAEALDYLGDAEKYHARSFSDAVRRATGLGWTP